VTGTGPGDAGAGDAGAEATLGTVAEAMARALCLAVSTRPADMAAALDLDADQGVPVGAIRAMSPADGLGGVRLALDPGSGLVDYVELSLPAEVPVAEITAVLGAPEELPSGPHDLGVTLAFPRITATGGTLSCVVLARTESPGTQVSSIIMYLHPVLDT